jgi:hypothetical protein
MSICKICGNPLKQGTSFCSKECHNISQQKKQLSKTELEDLYFNQGMNFSEIGRLIDVTGMSIRNRMAKFGINYVRPVDVNLEVELPISKERIITKVCDKNNSVLKKKIDTLSEEDLTFIHEETKSYPECSLYHRLKVYILGYDSWPTCELEGCDNPVEIVKQATFQFCKGCCPEHSKRVCSNKSAATQIKNAKPSKLILSIDEFNSKIDEVKKLGYVFNSMPQYSGTGYVKEDIICDLNCIGCKEDYIQKFNYSNMLNVKHPGYCVTCANEFSHDALRLKPNAESIELKLLNRGFKFIPDDSQLPRC